MTLMEGKNFFLKNLENTYNNNEIIYYYKLILSEVFKRNELQLALDPKSSLKKSEFTFLKRAIKNLLAQKPIQYIIGKVSFRSLTLNVNENVLIPRPETEELVDWVIEDFQNFYPKKNIIDIGTGSGCIAISLAKELKRNIVYALDNDDAILELAKQNAKKNNVKVNFFKKDINFLNSLNLKIDVIVSNPPYVLNKEKKNMKLNVLKHEPHEAIFVNDQDPLKFYRLILDYAKLNLQKSGLIYFEINPLLIKDLKRLITAYNFKIKQRIDIFEKVRMLRLQKSL
tara:strand:- start:23499 stop:24350 length:852 start_codon:yes stop_codon:yes gene_type:complete